MENNNITLIFLHILKTAGTSLQHLLMRNYENNNLFKIDQRYFRSQEALDEFVQMSAEARFDIDCLVGHVPYGIHDHLPRQSQYITMLRDPVGRTVSMYHFMRSNPAPYIKDLLDNKESISDYEKKFRGFISPEINNNNSIEAFIEFLVESNSINLQTRMCAGQVSLDRVLPPYDELPGDALENAKEHIKGFLVCGLLEKFDESVLLMKYKLGWGSAYYTRENAARPKTDTRKISKHTRRKIEEYCALDMELYEFAYNMLNQEIIDCDIDKNLSSFRKRNSLYQKYRNVRQAIGI